ncbi:hypothetical protein NA57DRAFT_82267 [Rhizodiscina lignyota]|uniref:Uncharacterized protein n=1 Tax=Rhizodiscina lignyota TaxID=1504668 RepID=A0A9P4I4Z8_9PEZI|nr:hypothetical protein NA57DRAFT_82267 [Rhizodiscina lignyota]
MPLIRRFLQLTTVGAATGTAGWMWYTRNIHFVPFDATSPDFTSPISKRLNPSLNKPSCIDDATRSVPLSKLKTTDIAELTRDYCRGVWGGLGFEIQRRELERRHRHKEGKESQLWDVKDLKESEYPVGTRIADHFEVVEHTPDKVVIRCGDSPDVPEHRASDGIFSLEVAIEGDVATFHMKSIFFNSLPNASYNQLPWHIKWAHMEYDKLLLETAVRSLLR